MDRDKTTVVVSHIDLDGYGCNIVAQKYLGRDVRIFNANYDDLAITLVDIPRKVQLFITDLSVPENLKGLLEEFDKVIIIDHHKSTMWALDWAKDNPKVEAWVSEERCATWWFYDYLAKEYGIRDEYMDEWVKYIDDYDRYVHDYPESRRLNSLFYISNRDRFVSDALLYTPKQVLDANKERIDRYLEQQKEYIQKTTVFELSAKDPHVVLMFAEKNKSAIAEVLLERGVDLVYGVDLHNMTVSLRSSEKSRIDCSKVARMIHPEGGGHPNASGASLDSSKWIRNVYDDDGFITKVNAFDMMIDFPIDDLPTYEDGDGQ